MTDVESKLDLVPLQSVFSVYSVVRFGKVTTEYTESTEKTLIRES